MFSKFFVFIAQFFQENNGRSSAKRLPMIFTVVSALTICFFSYFQQKEIPATALALIQTLIGASSATYAITRFKEGKKDDSPKDPS